MNIERIVEQRCGALQQAIEEARAAITSIEEAGNKTAEVLQVAAKHGVKTVGLNRGLGENGWQRVTYGDLLTPEADRINGWPAAWTIAEQSGIGGGCGNSGQHQIRGNSVIDGIYVCVDGIWERLSDADAEALYDKNCAKRSRL